MVYDIDMLRKFYALYPERVEKARKKLGRAMTLAEKYCMLIYMMRQTRGWNFVGERIM